MALEDVVEQGAVAGAEQDGVVGDVVVAAVGAEIPDEEAHGVTGAVDAAVGPAAAVLGGDEAAVGPGGVGVGDDEVGADGLAVGEADAGGAAVGRR